MSVVLDASLTLAWCFKDESTPYTNAVLKHVADNGAVVPSLWLYEIANGLVGTGRRQGLKQAAEAAGVPFFGVR